MKYAFYPGCVAKGGCPELYLSVQAIAPQLELELVELHDAACTGAGVLSERNPELADTLNARTFALAERLGLPLMTICSTCQGVMSQSNGRLSADEKYLAQINEYLAPEGLHYSGNTEVKHLLWVVVEDFGLDRLRTLITKPLLTVRVAPFYGCYILRPREQLGYEERPERGQYLEWVIQALQGEPVDYSGKTKCCGFPIATMNLRNSLTMVANHLLEAKDNGADCLVTPCPLCHLNLDGQQAEAEGQRGQKINLPVLHLPQLIGLAFGLAPDTLGLGRNIVSTRAIVQKIATAR